MTIITHNSNVLHLFTSSCGQESYFHWAFGVLEPDWYGMIESSSGRTTLFCPRLPQDYALILGRICPPEDFKKRYLVDRVYYVDQVNASGQLFTSSYFTPKKDYE